MKGPGIMGQKIMIKEKLSKLCASWTVQEPSEPSTQGYMSLGLRKLAMREGNLCHKREHWFSLKGLNQEGVLTRRTRGCLCTGYP